MNLIVRLCLMILFGTAACNDAAKQQSKSDGSTQKSINEIKLTDLKDQPVDLTKYKGKTIFVNFWATWCKPCVEEMPSIQNVMGALEKENIEFLFASDETTEVIERFNKQYNFSFRFVKTESYEQYDIMGLPTTFIFNSDGKLVFSEMGYRKWDDQPNIDLILNIIKTK
jgi:thiol-disulfide isomerase/thioredoxin